jgi:hypothetical protein
MHLALLSISLSLQYHSKKDVFLVWTSSLFGAMSSKIFDTGYDIYGPGGYGILVASIITALFAFAIILGLEYFGERFGFLELDEPLLAIDRHKPSHG